MKTVSFKQQTCVMGENQPEYNPLPAERRQTKEGEVIACWKPTFWERIRILFGQNIYTSLFTFGSKIQPQRVTVGYPERIYTFWDGVDENGKKLNERVVKESNLTLEEKAILKINSIDFHENI